MDRQAFFDAMDRAITKVARTEFLSLTNGNIAATWCQLAHAALDALGKLRRGIPPNYEDPWVALFYLTWYQPGQVNMARDLIGEMNRKRRNRSLIENNKRRLHVVDFGSGALAMQFAIAWAAADAIARGESIDSIRIDSSDQAAPMLRLGGLLWEEFKLQVKKAPSLKELSCCVQNVIKPQYHSPTSPFTLTVPPQNEERWLSAIHTVYKNNLEPVKQGLSGIANALNPTVGIISCHSDDHSVRLLRQASPFDALKLSLSVLSMCPHINNDLHDVTTWRRSLSVGPAKHAFLDKPVTWDFARAHGLVYTRLG